MRNIRAAMGGGGDGEGTTAAGNCGANHRQREGGRGRKRGIKVGSGAHRRYRQQCMQGKKRVQHLKMVEIPH